MSYQTGTATDLADLLGKLMTFAVANGWTQDELDLVNGNIAFHRNSIYISGRWFVATPLQLSLHQALAFDGISTEPGDHTDDSGNGYNTNSSHSNGNLDNERCVYNIGDGSFTYFFFESDYYLHVVVEISTDVFRHMHFGSINKEGDWTGGEYCCGQMQIVAGPISTDNTALFDGLFADTGATDIRRASTIHMEGLPGQDGSGKWGQISGNHSTTPPTDSAGNPKASCQGGFRGGPIARNFGWIPSSASTGMVTMVQIGLWYVDTGSNLVYLLGYMPDVRFFNIRNFAPKQEITISADTWVLFPTSKRTQAVEANSTYYSGVAYKKVTT